MAAAAKSVEDLPKRLLPTTDVLEKIAEATSTQDGLPKDWHLTMGHVLDLLFRIESGRPLGEKWDARREKEDMQDFFCDILAPVVPPMLSAKQARKNVLLKAPARHEEI